MRHILITLSILITTIASAQDTTEYHGLLNKNFLDNVHDTLITNIWIDERHDSFAVLFKTDSGRVCFYNSHNGKLAPKGTYKINTGMDCLNFEDLNGDGTYEILIGTAPNVNANQFFDVFIYDAAADSIAYVGGLSTDYTVDTLHKTIAVKYSGSFFEADQLELYKWHGYKLIPEKRAVCGPIDATHSYFEYYTNPTHTPNGLKRTRRQNWNKNDKQQQQLWNNFFKTK